MRLDDGDAQHVGGRRARDIGDPHTADLDGRYGQH